MRSNFFEELSNTFIIAEVGNNHEGDFEIAKDMVHIAAESGVDAIKFQTFKSKKWFHPSMPSFPRAKILGFKNQLSRMESVELKTDEFLKLKELAESKNIKFMTTFIDLESIDEFGDQLDLFKISSGEIINHQLIRKIAKFHKPIILSTGQANKNEIDRALDCIDHELVSLLHCVSSYPTDYSDANLKAIKTLQDNYKFPIGYSDHTIGELACLSAVAMGASIIEKHFSLDPSKGYGDHTLSADPHELKSIVEKIRIIEKMFGSGDISCQNCELDSKKQLRRNIVLNKHKNNGDYINEEDLDFLITEFGISILESDRVIGKRLNKELYANTPICYGDLI
jgi:N,N'-diacetyllegionaminate synthase